MNCCCHGYAPTSRRHVDLSYDLTPLHLASHQGHIGVVQALLKVTMLTASFNPTNIFHIHASRVTKANAAKPHDNNKII